MSDGQVLVYKIEANKELRFYVRQYVDNITMTTLELKSGAAEIFGAELELNKKYTFSPESRVSVFTYSGCTVELRNASGFVTQNLFMMYYLSLHSTIQQLRERAELDDDRGPIVLIAGPRDSGKSTLSTILINYALRMKTPQTPVYVETDPGQNSLSLPGTIGAALMKKQIHDREEYSQLDPLVFNVCSNRLQKNTLYKTCVSKLGSIILEKLKTNKKASTAGVIINTAGWTIGEGFDLIKHTAQAFEVDLILVLHQKKLFEELEKQMPQFVKVVQVPKSEAATYRSAKTREMLRYQMVRNYFYGSITEMHPYMFDVAWNTLKIYKMYYHFEDAESSKCQLSVLQLYPTLKSRIVAISFAEKYDDILEANISGFFCITDLSIHENKITVLSPQPPPLPNSFFVLTPYSFQPENPASYNFEG